MVLFYIFHLHSSTAFRTVPIPLSLQNGLFSVFLSAEQNSHVLLHRLIVSIRNFLAIHPSFPAHVDTVTPIFHLVFMLLFSKINHAPQQPQVKPTFAQTYIPAKKTQHLIVNCPESVRSVSPAALHSGDQIFCRLLSV